MPHRNQNDSITPETKVPLYVVGTAVGLGILIGSMWVDIRTQLSNAVTRDQMQTWVDVVREKNPGLHVPSIPVPPGYSRTAQK